VASCAPESLPLELPLPLLEPLPLLLAPLLPLLLPLPPLLLGSIGSCGRPPPLLLPLLLLLVGIATHSPPSQSLEQHWPKVVHEPPLSLHTAVGPPQTFWSQSSLQHCDFEVHDAPSAEHAGAAHTPLAQLALQQSVFDWHVVPTAPQVFWLAPPPDPDPAPPPPLERHTPEQARLQQSE
jgi:hypothetical protein